MSKVYIAQYISTMKVITLYLNINDHIYLLNFITSKNAVVSDLLMIIEFF